MNKSKWMRMQLKRMISVVLAAGIMTAVPVTDIYATVISDNSISQNEVYAETENYGNISSYNFQISEIRTGKTATFNGNDGKYGILVFGGIGSCSYTSTVLRYLDSLLESMDKSEVNVYAIDIKNNTDADIKSGLALENISNNIFTINERKGTECSNLLQICFQIKQGQGFSMPMVLFKDKSGNIYDYTEGSVGISNLAEKMIEGGMQVNYDDSMQKLNITAQESYTYAYEVLKLVNEERKKAGLSALTMDKDLLAAAMNRAAECSVVFSHTRPNGLSCHSINSKLSGENIAHGQENPQEVMESWMNSDGHRANILGSSYKSIGIGCVKVGHEWTWTQCFGAENASEGSKPADGEKIYGIMANASVNPRLVQSTTGLMVGDSKVLQPISWGYAVINADSYSWESDSDCVTVDAAGKVTAVHSGYATITATNKNAPSKKFTHRVIVTDYTDFDKPGNDSSSNSEKTDTSDLNETIPNGPDSWESKSGTEGFVYRLYNVALTRDAEPAGLADWNNKLTSKTQTAAEVAQGIFFSQEFQNKNYSDVQYVKMLYRTMFGREADEAGLKGWIEKLNSGMSREYVYHGFAESQEFQNLCDSYNINRGTVTLGQYRDKNEGATGYVARLYTKMLGRKYEDNGIEYWCKQYLTGKATIESIATNGFLHSQEFTNLNLSNEEFVTRMYQTFLNREPDEAGYKDWVSKLNSGEKTRDDLVYGFSLSQEFSNLKKSYGL